MKSKATSCKLNWSKQNYLFVIVILCLIEIINGTPIRHRSIHNHHKRLSSIKFDYDSTHTHQDDAHKTQNVYFPLNTSVNLTCTVTNPSYLYRMKMVKSLGNGSDSIQLINIDDSYIVNPALQKKSHSRYEVLTNEVEDSNNLKLTFVMKHLRFSDSGIYKCHFHNLNEELNLIVYKPLTQNDVVLTASNGSVDVPNDNNDIELELGSEYTFTCRANEVHPVASIKYILNNNNEILDGDFHDTIETTKSNHEGFELYTSIKTYKLRAKYEDHDNVVACNASQNVPGSDQIASDALTLKIKGIEFIERLCPEEVHIKFGMENTTISCEFYAYSDPKTSWWIPNMNTLEPLEAIDQFASEDETRKSETFNLLESNDKYIIKEEVIKPGIIRASLTIVDPLTENDVKMIKFEIRTNDESKSRTIKFRTEEIRDASIAPIQKQQETDDPNSSTSIHSKSIIGFILNLCLYRVLNF